MSNHTAFPLSSESIPESTPSQSSKRRRLNDASHTLSKPFKSPYKIPLNPQPDTQINIPTPSPSPLKDDGKARGSRLPASSPPEPSYASVTTPHGKSLLDSNGSEVTELPILQKHHTHLLNHLSASRASLETSNQALKVEESDRDADLEGLIAKWRLASRAAAEEVFAKARDKVNKMGGVGAMRDREKMRTETAWGWDDAPKKENEDSEIDNDRDIDGFRLGEKEGEEQDEREDGAEKRENLVDDNEGYTMDNMLKSLNIELGLIGFDKALQRWVD